MGTNDREAFVHAVHQSAQKPIMPHAHDSPPVKGEPGRANIKRPLSDHFIDRAEATGMTVARLGSMEEAADAAQEYMADQGIVSALCWDTPELRSFGEKLGDVELSWWAPSDPDRKTHAFAMKCGITTVDYAVAETGSLVVCGTAEKGRSVTMLGEHHIALVRADQILPDLYDLFPKLQADHPNGLPASVSLITGPSKTADIELQLVVGVHGPGAVHIILIEE